MTAPTTGHFNQPLAVNKTAIINHLAHHATNGPAYVQLNATKALARITGLYDQARYEAKLTYEAARKAAQDMTEQVKEKVEGAGKSLYQQIKDINSGRTPVTEEMLGDYASMLPNRDEKQDDDEEEDESANDSEDPP